MRPSCYLNVVDIGDGNSLLYNGFSMCIDVVPSEIAHRLVAPGAESDLSFLMPSEQELLAVRGHLTTLNAAGEREEMRRLARAAAVCNAEPGGVPFGARMITFVLTYGCNLSCAYCYQKEIRKNAGDSSMSEAFVDEFFRNYMDKLVAGGGERSPNLLLYGGEPMLPENRGAIVRILAYAKEHGNFVHTVTNAVLLPTMLDLVGPQKGKINSVQFTLDGGRGFHDKQRFSQSGGPTFEQTIQALRKVIETGAEAVIRIHLHPEKLESARLLVDYLEGEKFLGHDRVKVYFWSTEDLHGGVLSEREQEIFCKLYQDVALKQNSLPTAHFAFLERIMDMKDAVSRPVRRHCDLCVAGLHCVVDSLGDIYECIDDAGHKERRRGVLAGGGVDYLTPGGNSKKPHLRDKPECLECPIAFFCGGGCINRIKVQNGSTAEQFCLQVKEFVGLTLKTCFIMKKNKLDGAKRKF